MTALSLIFSTMDRAFAAQRLILSVRQYFPDIAIHVVEQSDQATPLRAVCQSLGVDHLRLPHDCGVAAARNAAVARVKTDYFILCDDDFILTDETEFEPALHILRHHPEVGVVGGRLWDIHGTERVERHWQMFLNIDPENRILTAVPANELAPSSDFCGPYGFFYCDAVLNFAVMRRAIFDGPAGWDPQFQCNGEHEDFYLNLKQNSDVRVVYYPGMVADHHHIGTPGYARLRNRAEGWRAFMQKWQIDQHLALDEGLQTLDEPGVLHRQDQARQRRLQASLETTNDPASLCIDAKGRLTLTARPNGPHSSIGAADTTMLAVYAPGDVAAVPQPAQQTKPKAQIPSTPLRDLQVFAAHAPTAGPGSDQTLWLRIERIRTGNVPRTGLDLPVTLRWRHGERYLNWDMSHQQIRLSPQTTPDWLAIQAEPPFSTSLHGPIELELWCGHGVEAERKAHCHILFNKDSSAGLTLGLTPAAPIGNRASDLVLTSTLHPTKGAATSLACVDLLGLEGAVLMPDTEGVGPIAVPTKLPQEGCQMVVAALGHPKRQLPRVQVYTSVPPKPFLQAGSQAMNSGSR